MEIQKQNNGVNKKKWIWLLALIPVAGILSFLILSSTSVKVFFIGEKAKNYHDKGRLEQAILSYERLIELDPSNYSNYFNLAMAHLQNGEKAKAKKQIAKLRAMGSDDVADMLQDLINRNN